MTTNVFRKLHTVRRIGFRLSLRIFLERLYLKALTSIFHFHPWHAAAPISARPYRCLVARIVNDLTPATVVEVGCGLGEIIIRVKAPFRYGFDIDEGVIRAARFIRRRSVQFFCGGLSSVNVEKMDVLILVNWIHELSAKDLEAQLSPLLSRVKYVLVDVLDADVPGEKHDFVFLKACADLVRSERVSNEDRSFQLFKVNAA